MLSMTPDNQGNTTYGVDFSPSFLSTKFTLSANTLVSVTVPSNYAKYLACFNSNANGVWVGYNVNATVPTGTPTWSAQELDPASRNVKAGDTLTFITSNSSTQVNVKFLYTQG